jgi:hypothetical protein
LLLGREEPVWANAGAALSVRMAGTTYAVVVMKSRLEPLLPPMDMWHSLAWRFQRHNRPRVLLPPKPMGSAQSHPIRRMHLTRRLRAADRCMSR